jgi:hypothetical protein
MFPQVNLAICFSFVGMGGFVSFPIPFDRLDTFGFWVWAVFQLLMGWVAWNF